MLHSFQDLSKQKLYIKSRILLQVKKGNSYKLIRKALVTTIIGDPIKARGGKSRRFYRITKKGFKALEEVKTLQKQTWENLPDPVFK